MIERKERITLEMNMQQAIFALSDGNPGAITVLVNILKADPTEGFFKLLNFDSFGIYGSKIWIFYKDVCGENLDKMLSVLDEVRSGKLSEDELFDYIDNYKVYN